MGIFLCWIESHPGLANWVQAVGTLLAIGIAIAIPAWQHSVEVTSKRRVTKRLQRAIALHIREDIRTVRMELQVRVNEMQRAIDTGIATTTIHPHQVIVVGHGLRKMFDSVANLAHCSVALQDLAVAINEFNKITNSSMQIYDQTSGKRMNASYDKIIIVLQKALDSTLQTEQEIEVLLN